MATLQNGHHSTYLCTPALLDLACFWPMADSSMGPWPMGALCTLSPHVHICPSCTLHVETGDGQTLIPFGTDGKCQVLREDCLLASVARLTEARESFYVAVFGFVALPPGDEFS